MSTMHALGGLASDFSWDPGFQALGWSHPYSSNIENISTLEAQY